MKITVSQLKKIIAEEVQKTLSEVGPKSRAPKLALGNIYMNSKREQISVEFLEGGYAGWELLSRGKAQSKDGTVEELEAELTSGGFEFDHNERVY